MLPALALSGLLTRIPSGNTDIIPGPQCYRRPAFSDETLGLREGKPLAWSHTVIIRTQGQGVCVCVCTLKYT